MFTSKCQLLNCVQLCNPPDSSVHGILQLRRVEWVAIPFFRGSSQPRDSIWVSCIAGRFFTIWTIIAALTSKREFTFYILLKELGNFITHLRKFLITKFPLECKWCDILIKLLEIIHNHLGNVINKNILCKIVILPRVCIISLDEAYNCWSICLIDNLCIIF